MLSLAPLLRGDQQDEGTSFPASERNSTCLRILFLKHLLAAKSLVSRCQSGNRIHCMWPWQRPGIEARLGHETTLHTSSVAKTPEASASAVALGASWKHTSYTCSEVQDRDGAGGGGEHRGLFWEHPQGLTDSAHSWHRWATERMDPSESVLARVEPDQHRRGSVAGRVRGVDPSCMGSTQVS